MKLVHLRIGVRMSNNGYLTIRDPEWIEVVIPKEYYDEDFYKIMMFFVFHSPCLGQSKRMITLQDRGWKKEPWHSSSYLKDKFDDAIFGDNIRLYKMSESHNSFEEAIESLNLGEIFYNKRDKQRFCHVKVNKPSCQSVYMSFFYHLRNMLAHARIAMYPAKHKDICFVMEDGENVEKDSDAKFRVSARAVIFKSSLLRIIDLLENPPEDREYAEDILKLINAGKNT